MSITSLTEIGGSKTQLLRGAAKRARALSLPRNIYTPILKRIGKWYSCSGEGWTIDRIKSIKLDIIRNKAGMPPVSSWITRNSSGFKGEFGALEKWMLKSDKHFYRGIQLLQIYTLFYSRVVTSAQKEKFLSGVECPPPSPSIIDFGKTIVDQGFSCMPHTVTYREIGKPQSLASMLPSPNKRAPLLKSSVPEVEGIVESMEFLFETIEGASHYNKYKWSHYRYLLDGLWDSMCDPNNRSDNHKVFNRMYAHNSFLVGRIGLIQEPGYKLRAVANPGRVFQRVLEPLGNRIYTLLKGLPYDCTFDQYKAIPALQSGLTNGQTIYSIDLSGATDYFPLALQRHLLLKMFPEIEVNLFCDLSQASWYMPDHGEISWKRGQPLGLYPSFGAFALTHGALLMGLLNKEWDNQFFILGDDVVILEDQLAHDYLQVLQLLGCPVSTSKSLTSKTLCEFGGKLITAHTIIDQYKWRGVSDNSFKDIARNIGPKSLCLFKPRQIAVLKAISSIPEFFGGLGWNPKGIPLSSRVSLLTKEWDETVPVDHLMDYSPVILRNLFSSKKYRQTMFHREIGHNVTLIDKHRDLEQRSSLFVRKTLSSSLWNMDKRILGKNIDAVSLSLYGRHADLPINALNEESLRPTVLCTLEAKVRHLKRQASLS